MRRRAQAVSTHGLTGDCIASARWEILKRTEKAARARAAQREAQDANSTSAKRELSANGLRRQALV